MALVLKVALGVFIGLVLFSGVGWMLSETLRAPNNEPEIVTVETVR